MVLLMAMIFLDKFSDDCICHHTFQFSLRNENHSAKECIAPLVVLPETNNIEKKKKLIMHLVSK